MTTQEERLEQCNFVGTNHLEISSYLVLGQSVTYYMLLYYTLCRHRKHIRNSNVCLLISWAIEVAIRLTLIVLR